MDPNFLNELVEKHSQKVSLAIKKLSKHFMRSQTVLSAAKARRKATMVKHVKHYLFNFMRKINNINIITFEKEFEDIPTAPTTAPIDDKFWSTRELLGALGYQIQGSDSNAAKLYRIQLQLKSVYKQEDLTKMANKIINTLKETKSEKELYDILLNELGNSKVQKNEILLPSEVNVDLYQKYLTHILSQDIEDSTELRWIIVRYVLIKHNKLKAADADKLIKIDLKPHKKLKAVITRHLKI